MSNSFTNSNDKVNTNAGGLGDFVIELIDANLLFVAIYLNLQDPADTFLTRRNKPIFQRILVKFDGF